MSRFVEPRTAAGTEDEQAGGDAARTRVLCRIAFLVLWACTPLYLVVLGRRVRGRGHGPPAVELVVSSAAFVALVLFTVLSGLVVPPTAAPPAASPAAR